MCTVNLSHSGIRNSQNSIQQGQLNNGDIQPTMRVEPDLVFYRLQLLMSCLILV